MYTMYYRAELSMRRERESRLRSLMSSRLRSFFVEIDQQNSYNILYKCAYNWLHMVCTFLYDPYEVAEMLSSAKN